MPDPQYSLVTHAEVPDLIPQLTRLSNAAFVEYEGTMQVEEPFIEWYLRRPGSCPELCVGALYGDRLVSNVLVALQVVQLDRRPFLCGIIDTVATDPDHRQRGLARRLMDEAHRLMRAAGAEAALLYTNPEGHPYRFYQRLGYETQAFGLALLGSRPAPGELQPAAASPDDTPAAKMGTGSLFRAVGETGACTHFPSSPPTSGLPSRTPHSAASPPSSAARSARAAAGPRR